MTAEPPPARLVTLDAVRGVAVIGILIVNIIAFAMPADAYINPAAWGGTAMDDLAAWWIVQLLFEGRMRGLFALLFGASALLVMQRAAANAARVHLARMAVLFGFGVAHFVLLWNGDILASYALLGLLLVGARDWSPRRLAATGVAAIGVYAIAWSAALAAVLVSGEDTGGLATTSAEIADELAYYRGGYAEIVVGRVTEEWWAPLVALLAIGGEPLGYMFVGMALLKTGFFDGGWDDARLRRWMWRCYAVSLPPIAGLTWWGQASGFDPVVLMGNFVGWTLPFRLISTIGHAALIVLLVRRFATSRVVMRLAAAGRMAFTNYIATSIVMTTIFYGYGLGLFGQVDRAPVYLFVAGMAAAMLLWSKPWLDRFAYGPLEWAWRSLSRRERQRWRRNALAS